MKTVVLIELKEGVITGAKSAVFGTLELADDVKAEVLDVLQLDERTWGILSELSEKANPKAGSKK